MNEGLDLRVPREAMPVGEELPGLGQGGTKGHGVCSTKYVRGREAVMPDLRAVAFIANCP